jgi:hypothetical protein
VKNIGLAVAICAELHVNGVIRRPCNSNGNKRKPQAKRVTPKSSPDKDGMGAKAISLTLHKEMNELF